jgi:dihydrofolate synthase / folylpolyglutamate synthase
VTPDPVERLFALEQFGIKLGLDNIRQLVKALGNPHDQFVTVHIAGTNGKGSVSAMVERAVRHGGYRTGRYTSPHLARIEERIAVDGEPIREGVFREVTTDVFAVVDRLRAAGTLETMPTFFEVTTAIAFEAFRRKRVQVGVIEVGLGGRFDATNVVTPKVTAIASIALDHEKHLGHTLAAIAFEKAGILKRGVPAVIGTLHDEARGVIEDVASRTGAPIVDADVRLVDSLSMRDGRATISVTTPQTRYEHVMLALNGRHQVANAVVAIRVLEQLDLAGVSLDAAAILTGLSEARWPARLEWLRVGPGALLIDAAHNVAGAQALAGYLVDSGVAPLPIVLAVMKDKDVDGIIAAIAPVAARFVATTVPTSARALPAATLASHIGQIAPAAPVETIDDPGGAVAAALAAAPRAVAAGSIFFVGPLRARLCAAGALSLQGS